MGDNFNPAMVDLSATASDEYPGEYDTPPTFDDEIQDLDSEMGDLGPEGKGPSRGYKERWRAIARHHALGHTNNQIGRKLGYSPAGVSLALKQPWVQDEVARYRAQYEADITTRVKDAALDGIDRIHRIINDDKAKNADALHASIWSVEKATGKARQEINVESGTFSNFMDILKDMRARKEPLDVTPQLQAPIPTIDAESTASPQPQWSNWIKANV